MTQEELQAEYERLTKLETINDCLDLLDIFLEHIWNVMTIHHEDEVYSLANKDAKILNQMIFTKLTHLKKIIEGVGYEGADGNTLNDIIDPTIVASLIRNIYETVSVFNLIYRSTNNADEKLIIYGLWVIAGLNYRQRFEANITTQENLQKFAEEKRQIESIISEIKETDLYKSLGNAGQRKIESRIKGKEFKIQFIENKVKCLNWQDMTELMNLNNDIFGNIYTYFSLYSHPSQVSVFQFENMFNTEDEAFIGLTTVNMKYCFSLISVFVSDYINLFPNVKNTFETLEVEKQIAINAHNKMLRGDEYSINEAWRQLE